MTIQFKRSNVAGKVPVAADLKVGELAINLADSKIYSKNGAGAVTQIAGPKLPWAASSTGTTIGMNLTTNTTSGTGCVLRIEDNGTTAHTTHGALQTMYMSGSDGTDRKFITFVNKNNQVGHVDGLGNMWLKGSLGINTGVAALTKINVNAGASRLGLNIAYAYGETNRAGIRVEDASATDHDNVSASIRLFSSNIHADRTKQFFIRGINKQDDNTDIATFSVRRDGHLYATSIYSAGTLETFGKINSQDVISAAKGLYMNSHDTDHGYVSFFTNKAAPTSRTAWVGFGSSLTANTFAIGNERGGGQLSFSNADGLRFNNKQVLLGDPNGAAGRWDALTSRHFTGTPVHGVKIKTNIPFTNGVQMPQIRIEGNPYAGRTMDILLNFYIHNDTFYSPSASTSGGYAPPIILGVEDGKVVIFLNDKKYYSQYHVSAVSSWVPDIADHFKDWSITDDALTATNQVNLSYHNSIEHLHTSGTIGVGITPSAAHRVSIWTNSHRSDDSGALRVADDGNANHSDIQGVVKASTSRADINKNLFLGQRDGTKVFAVDNYGKVYTQGTVQTPGISMMPGVEGGIVAGVNRSSKRFWIAPNRKVSQSAPVHDSSYTFAKGTVVRSGSNAYKAKQAVPKTIVITDTTYWEDLGSADSIITADYGSEFGYDATNKRWYTDNDFQVGTRLGVGTNPNLLTLGYGSHKLNIDSSSGNGALIKSNGITNSNLTVVNMADGNTGGIVRIIGGNNTAGITIRKGPSSTGDGTLQGQWTTSGNFITYGTVQIGKEALPTNDKFRVLSDTSDDNTYAGVFLNQKYGNYKNSILSVCHNTTGSLLFHGQSYDNEARSSTTDRFKVTGEGALWAKGSITTHGPVIAVGHVMSGMNTGVSGQQLEAGNADIATHRFDAKTLRFWCGNSEHPSGYEMLRLDGTAKMSTFYSDISLSDNALHSVSAINFTAASSDKASIATTVENYKTYLDFNVGDDEGGDDRFRFIANPFGGNPARPITEMWWTDASDVNSGYVKTYGMQYAVDFIKTSDIRNKKDVVTVPHALETISKLRGVDYTWKHNNDRDSGVIAQEVEQVLPHLVHTDPDSDGKSVSYSGFTGVFIEAFKELKAENEMLKNELAKMQAPDVSVAAMNELKQELANIKKVLGI